MDTTIRQLRSELKEILDLVAQGETVTITKHGKPCAKIVPVGTGEQSAGHDDIFNLWKDHHDIQDASRYIHDQRRRHRVG